MLCEKNSGTFRRTTLIQWHDWNFVSNIYRTSDNILSFSNLFIYRVYKHQLQLKIFKVMLSN